MASQASCSSLRPESLENSVWPMPAMAVRRESQALTQAPRASGRRTSAVPDTWSPRSLRAGEGDLDHSLATVEPKPGDRAGEDAACDRGRSARRGGWPAWKPWRRARPSR